MAYNLHALRDPWASPRNRKVLLVEDNADVRRLYAIGLNQRGFEVKLAANGAEAVDRVATERPDYILLDWMMPLMDGRRGRGASRSAEIGLGHRDHRHQRTARSDRRFPARIRSWLTKP